MVVISEELAQNLLGLCSAFPTPGGKQKVAVGAIQCALEEAVKAAREKPEEPPLTDIPLQPTPPPQSEDSAAE